MQPSADLSALDHLLTRVNAMAEPSRAKRLRVVSPVLLLDTAIAEMARQHEVQGRRLSRRAAERFRDALLVAFLATRPVRLANLTAIELVKQLSKRADVYWCKFTGAEMKDGRPLEFPLPRALTHWLDLYLAVHRPLLLRGTQNPRLWITIRSTSACYNTIYCRVTRVTRKLIGRSINPHLFRDCVATFIEEVAPEQVMIIARILGHSTLATSEAYYNQAGMLSAHKRYMSALTQLRDGPGTFA